MCIYKYEHMYIVNKEKHLEKYVSDCNGGFTGIYMSLLMCIVYYTFIIPP